MINHFAVPTLNGSLSYNDQKQAVSLESGRWIDLVLYPCSAIKYYVIMYHKHYVEPLQGSFPDL